MAQSPGETSSQNSLTVYFSSVQSAGTLVTLADENSSPIIGFAPSKDYQSIVISSPELEQGKTYTLISGGTNSSTSDNGLYIGGSLSGGSKLTDVTLSTAVTRISDTSFLHFFFTFFIFLCILYNPIHINPCSKNYHYSLLAINLLQL